MNKESKGPEKEKVHMAGEEQKGRWVQQESQVHKERWEQREHKSREGREEREEHKSARPTGRH